MVGTEILASSLEYQSVGIGDGPFLDFTWSSISSLFLTLRSVGVRNQHYNDHFMQFWIY